MENLETNNPAQSSNKSSIPNPTIKINTDKIFTARKIAAKIASEINASSEQVINTIILLDEGASVPFVARYRKEATGGLDDTQLRKLQERLTYLRELEERKIVILESILEQGKLTTELKNQIETAENKQLIEDLYLPFKPKRRTKAQIAREAGLQPLAEALFNNRNLIPQEEAKKYIVINTESHEKNIPDEKTALEGAKYILSEDFAQDAKLIEKLRQFYREQGILVAKVVAGKETEGDKFRDWFNYQEAFAKIPSHRALALFRGRNEDILRLALKTAVELAEEPKPSPSIGFIANHFNIGIDKPSDKWLSEVVRFTWMVKLSLQIEIEVMAELKEQAEKTAITVFAQNLRDLLLSAPAGAKVTMGLDPGIRTGVKVAIVDVTGKVVDTDNIYPHQPRNDWNGSLATLGRLIQKHKVQLIAIGNGTASRETDKLAGEICKLIFEHDGTKLHKIVVSEAGASVYSASALAAQEFPDLDVSLRGAVSIARRLQDPLAELVKIEPKSIGVGQYQHDVNQLLLAKQLDGVVEDCVNAVGVDINMASASLLAHISGLNSTLAENIINFRNQNGAFRTREQLKKIPRLGEKTFEQAAGFLRICDGDNPLDSSAVHPEAYPLVEKILKDIGKNAKELIGDNGIIKNIKPEKYLDEKFGLPTIRDILKELVKPGRDPRGEFKTASFDEKIVEISDLKIGMIVEGVVTNVTNFGAFVDVGVHQDGLVHISALSDTFVKDTRTVVKTGDVVKVKVLEVEPERKRIALSMRLSDEPIKKSNNSQQINSNNQKNSFAKNYSSPQSPTGALAEAFARAKK